MNEGLEALEKVKDFEIQFGGYDETGEYKNYISLYQTPEYQVIRKELQEKAKFDAFMKRYNIDSVEELDTFFNEHLNNDIDKCSKCKELKVTEFIKEHLIYLKSLDRFIWADMNNEANTFLKELVDNE